MCKRINYPAKSTKINTRANVKQNTKGNQRAGWASDKPGSFDVQSDQAGLYRITDAFLNKSSLCEQYATSKLLGRTTTKTEKQ